MNDTLFVAGEQKSYLMVPVKPVLSDLVTELKQTIYVPLATKNNYGSVKIGDGLLISNGVISFDEKEVPILSISLNDKLLDIDDNKNVNIKLTKDDVGLDRVDNTSDLDKPVSRKQQDALDLKLNTNLGAINYGKSLYVTSSGEIGLRNIGSFEILNNDGVVENDAHSLNFGNEFYITSENGEVSIILSDSFKESVGKINSISLNGEPQSIDQNKNVNLIIPIDSKLNKSNADRDLLTNQTLIINGDSVTLKNDFINLSTLYSSTVSNVLPLANDNRAGLMSVADYNSIRDLQNRVGRIEQKATRLMYDEKLYPTAEDISVFVTNLGYEYPYDGIAVVIEGTNHIWHFYEGEIGWKDDGVDVVSVFTNDIAGIIKGSNLSGKIYAETDGTGSVNGWDDLIAEVNDIQESVINNVLKNSKIISSTGLDSWQLTNSEGSIAISYIGDNKTNGFVFSPNIIQILMSEVGNTSSINIDSSGVILNNNSNVVKLTNNGFNYNDKKILTEDDKWTVGDKLSLINNVVNVNVTSLLDDINSNYNNFSLGNDKIILNNLGTDEEGASQLGLSRGDRSLLLINSTSSTENKMGMFFNSLNTGIEEYNGNINLSTDKLYLNKTLLNITDVNLIQDVINNVIQISGQIDAPYGEESETRYTKLLLGGADTNSKKWSIVIGANTKGGQLSVGLGNSVNASANGDVVVGSDAGRNEKYPSGLTNNGVAIGTNAKIEGSGTIQIGAGTNTEEGSFQVKNYKLLDANGIIPNERLNAELLSNIETSKDELDTNVVKLEAQTLTEEQKNQVKQNLDIPLELVSQENDPTVPEWAKQPTKPTYDYSEIQNTPFIPAGSTLYDTTGQNTDGSMTQKATTDYIPQFSDCKAIAIQDYFDITNYIVGPDYIYCTSCSKGDTLSNGDIILLIAKIYSTDTTSSDYQNCSNVLYKCTITNKANGIYSVNASIMTVSGQSSLVLERDFAFLSEVNSKVSSAIQSGQYTTYINNNGSSIDLIIGSGSTTVAKITMDSQGNIDLISSNFKINNTAFIDLVYPVNSIYISINNTSPASLFGGSWEALPDGYTLWTTTVEGEGGSSISAGLPNITGTLGAVAHYSNKDIVNGPFEKATDSYIFRSGQGTTIQYFNLNMDLSKSNAIYGKSNTVQPPAIKVYMWKRVA